MKLTKLLLVPILVSCSSGTPEPTWGDATEALTKAYCYTTALCSGNQNPVVYEECVSHNTFHLCTIDNTCDVEITDDDMSIMLDCTTAIYTIDDPESYECTILNYLGVLPDECSLIWATKP